MTINGTYQIRDLQIVNPTYEVVNVNDNLTNKTCIIEVVFDTDSVIKYSYSIGGGGLAGTGSTGGTDGADGGSGVIIVTEYY